MPHDATATDSELLAKWTVEAIQLDKLSLAQALIRLAVQARAVESATLVRMAGQTRDEQPVRPYLVPQPVDGPTGNGDADLARAEAAATAIFGKVAEKDLNVPVPGSRCAAYDVGAPGTECNAAIWWRAAQGHVDGGWWEHVDSAWDDHHQAVGPKLA